MLNFKKWNVKKVKINSGTTKTKFLNKNIKKVSIFYR